MGLAKNISNGGCSLDNPPPPSAFDPAFNAAEWTFSNFNRTVTRANNTAPEFARGTLSHVAGGPFYFEIQCNLIASAGVTLIGIATAAANPHLFLGTDVHGWGYYDFDGSTVNNNVFNAYGATFATGDVVGVLVDFTAGTIHFSKNGVDQGQAWNNVAGACFPVVSNQETADQFTIATNYSQFMFYPGGGALLWG